MWRLLALLPCTAVADGGTHFFVAAGRAFSFVVEDGVVSATGRNQYGQLGIDRTQEAVHGLEQVVGLPVTSADDNESTQVTQVAAGAFHTLFLLSTGEVYATGRNNHGQLGIGSTESQRKPVKLDLPPVAAVAAGYAHSVFLTRNSLERGIVMTVGCNSAGQLGDGTTTSRSTPVTPPTGDASAIAAGYDFTYASDGSAVWATGQNLGGQLGLGNKERQLSFQKGMAGVTAVFAGESHGLFKVQQETGGHWLYGTGANFDGQIGGGADGRPAKLPVHIPSLNPEVVSAGGDSSCVGEYDLKCFGSNRDGQLGLKDLKFTEGPTAVQLNGVDVDYADSIAVGETHSLWLSHMDVAVTGDNAYGQIGERAGQNEAFVLKTLERNKITTTEPTTPAPSPHTPAPPAPPTPAPAPAPTRAPQGGDGDGDGAFPFRMLFAGVCAGIGLVLVVMSMTGRGGDQDLIQTMPTEHGGVSTELQNAPQVV